MNERRIRITVKPRQQPDIALYVRALIELARQELEREAKDAAVSPEKPHPTPGDAA